MEEIIARSKGVIELNWKILVAIIATVVVFIIVFLVISGMLKAENIGQTAREICLLIVSKLQIFGLGAEKLGVCDVFIKA